MCRIFYIIFAIIISVGTNLTFAQGGEGAPRVPYHKFDMKAFSAERQAYMVAELKLTPEEAMAFIPMSEEYQEELFKIGVERRALMRKFGKDGLEREDLDEKDYEDILETFLELKQKEFDLERAYYKKFKTVISSKKIIMYRKAEMGFLRRYMEKHEGRRSLRNEARRGAN